MKKVIVLFTTFFLMGWSINVWAFSCIDATGQKANASVNIYANLTPTLQPGENLIVDLSNSILCKNDNPSARNDMVSLLPGSTYSGALSGLTGSIKYYGERFNFPLMSPTLGHNFTSGSYVPWEVKLFLTPTSSAGGIVIQAGMLIASLQMHQVGSDVGSGGNVDFNDYTWNIYANNDVIIPTGGCDVSARNVTVFLSDYPDATAVPVPVAVYCAQNQKLGYYLSGTMADTANSIFSNTAFNDAAQGIGIQITYSGAIVPANRSVSLGTVGTSMVDLDLKANYARTGGQVGAGNVQSIIGITFVYQ